MSNLQSILSDAIRRVSRREIRSQTKTVRKLTAQYRRDIAALKREVVRLRKTVGFLESQEKRRVSSQPAAPAPTEGKRFRADGLRSHRAKLGLSAADYGRLVGAAGLSIYHWESGKARPRAAQIAKLVAVRGIGKREALKRLELLGGGAASAGEPRRRRRGGPTAEEFIASLVKSKKANTSKQINVAWKQDGRPGRADNTLSRMIRLGSLRRTKLKGERGSTYAVAK